MRSRVAGAESLTESSESRLEKRVGSFMDISTDG
jgi:hypothetical protein